MYTIKRAAEITGIPVATLRAWERRYEIVEPGRTDSGYRLYDAEAVRALTVMNSLVQQGWSPRLAAAETKRRLRTAPFGRSRRALRSADAPLPDRPDEPAAQEVGDVDLLVEAAAELDAAGVTEILDDAFSRGSFEAVVDSWLLPAMRALGDAWSDGRVSVAGEHLVSYAVQRRLAAAYEAAAHRTDGARIVVGLPPGSRHELGLLAFATAARRAGLSTVYVGADLPAEDWSTAVEANDALAAVIAVPVAGDLRALREVVARLEESHPDLLIAVGGRMQSNAPEACHRLGHGLGAAAVRLAELVTPTHEEGGGTAEAPA